jgi:hypothetical protein
MKVKTNTLEYLNGNGVKERYITYKCDKCGMVGAMAVTMEQSDIPEDKKGCC